MRTRYAVPRSFRWIHRGTALLVTAFFAVMAMSSAGWFLAELKEPFDGRELPAGFCAVGILWCLGRLLRELPRALAIAFDPVHRRRTGGNTVVALALRPRSAVQAAVFADAMEPVDRCAQQIRSSGRTALADRFDEASTLLRHWQEEWSRGGAPARPRPARPARNVHPGRAGHPARHRARHGGPHREGRDPDAAPE